MQTTTYRYVYYSASGSHTRQPRAVPSQTFVNIPGATEPAPINLVTGTMFQANPAPQSYPGIAGESYQFAFMNVSGLAEGGRTSYDHSVPPAAGTVGTADINVLVVYVEISGGGTGGGSAATIDAFDQTKGSLVNDDFVQVSEDGINVNIAQTANGNVDGYVDTANAEIIQAYANINPDNGNFDKWAIFYQGSIDTAVDPNDATQFDVAAGDSPYAFAVYSSPVILPCPYVIGGYHSPDIKLYDLTTNTVVSTLDPNADSLLQPNTPYGFAAVIHNDTDADAINTDISFWEIPGGNGLMAVLLNTQRVVVIPAHGSVEVRSAVNFTSGQSALFPDEHNCAAVSVYNDIAYNTGGCCNNVTDVNGGLTSVSNNPGQPGCSAWKNTDAQWVTMGSQFNIVLSTGEFHHVHGGGPVELEVITQHVPVKWHEEDNVRQIADIFKTAGVEPNNQLYLLPFLRDTLKPIDLNIEVNRKEYGRLKQKKHRFILHREKGSSNSFEVSGIVPDTAREGDILLVNVIAHYSETEQMAATSIGFLQELHVRNTK